MLKTQTSATVNGQVTIGSDNTVVVYLSANVPESGNANITQTIQDKELFKANKTACLADITAFQEKVYAMGGTTDETN